MWPGLQSPNQTHKLTKPNLNRPQLQSNKLIEPQIDWDQEHCIKLEAEQENPNHMNNSGPN